MRKKLFFGHLFTLTFGGIIYIFFRSDSLVMFKWFSVFSLGTQIDYLRERTLTIKELFPDWFLFSFPDGLWIFSYISLMLLIWGNNIKMQNLFWFFFVPFIATSSEVGQFFNIVPGTFDPVDLIFYILGAVTPFTLYTKKISTYFTKKL